MLRRFRLLAALVASLFALGACSSGGVSRATGTDDDPVVAHGTAHLDGKRFDARWIGAVVLRGGLVTPCQMALPPIEEGRFRVGVFRGAESAGCGVAGSRVVFWTFVDERLFSTRAIPWSQLNDPVHLTFAKDDPRGTAPARTEFSGRAFDADGGRVPVGTRIEARVGRTTCGVASVRAGDGFRGYIMNVAGPDSRSACRDGATITFRIGGRPAVETAVNGQSSRDLFPLHVRTSGGDAGGPQSLGGATSTNGVSVRTPDDWHRASRPLAPWLTDPRELFSLATTPMTPIDAVGNQAACPSEIPKAGVEAVGTDGAYVWIGEAIVSTQSPQPRPVSFADAAWHDLCPLGSGLRTRGVSFSESGRVIVVSVVTAATTSDTTNRELVEMLDSIAVEPRAPVTS